MDRKDILNKAWEKRSKLREEARKFNLASDKLWTKENTMFPKGFKMRAKFCKLLAEGNMLWAEAILKTYGNMEFWWGNYNVEKDDHDCHLKTGEVFKP